MSSTKELSANLKILVVDDDAFISDILKRIIEKLGCEVKCIQDGNEVGNALIAYEPDVIFLDLVLPGIDGVEIIHGLSRAECKSKIVLMSGLDKRTLSSVSEGARQNQLDVIDAISKPFAPGQVEALLQPLIDSKSSTRVESETTQPSLRFGPQVLYELESDLDEELSSSNHWLRAILSWRMDDDSIVDLASLIGDKSQPKIAKGLIETLLRSTQADNEIFGNYLKDVNLKIPLQNELLLDDSTPDYLEQIVKQTGWSNNKILFEIGEEVIVNSTEFDTNILSRLKIKGFKLAVCVKDKDKADQVLARLDKLPIDELTINMSDDRFRGGQLDDSETEFQVASLVSFVSGADLSASVKNVFNQKQADFARRCKFSRASGRHIREPGSAEVIREFLNKD